MRISWREFLTVWTILTLAGAIVGMAMAVHDGVHGLSGSNLYVLLTFTFAVIYTLVASVVTAGLFAAVGAIVVSISLLLLQRELHAAGLVAWMCAGTVVGAVVGAFHPFVILMALSDPAGAAIPETLRLVGMASASGCAGGSMVGWWWYRTRMMGPRFASGVSSEA